MRYGACPDNPEKLGALSMARSTSNLQEASCLVGNALGRYSFVTLQKVTIVLNGLSSLKEAPCMCQLVFSVVPLSSSFPNFM